MIDPSHSIAQVGRKSFVGPIHRRSRLFLLLAALSALALFISACGGGAQADAAGVQTIAFESLPEGMGRGYPVVSLEGIDNAKNGTDSGDHAADFVLTLEDGSQLRLSDLQGRPVMLNFWATWCPPCRQEMPDIIKAYETADNDLVVLSINERENIDAVKPFAEAFGISMPVALDEDGRLADIYGVRGMPTSVFINRDGVVVAKWSGFISPDVLGAMLDSIP